MQWQAMCIGSLVSNCARVPKGCGNHHQTAERGLEQAFHDLGYGNASTYETGLRRRMCQAFHDLLKLDRLEIIDVSTEGCCSGDLTASGPPPTYPYMILCNYSTGLCIEVEARSGVEIKYEAVGTLARRRGLCEGRWRKSEPCWRAWTRRRLFWCGTANPNFKLGSAGLALVNLQRAHQTPHGDLRRRGWNAGHVI